MANGTETTRVEVEVKGSSEATAGNTPVDDIQVGEAAADTASDFLTRYRNVIAVALVGVLLIIAGYWYYTDYIETQNKEAIDEMFVAVRYFEDDSLDKALKGTTEHRGLEFLADEYSGTEAGNLCKYYLGLTYLKKYQVDTTNARNTFLDKAQENLENYSKSDNLLAMGAYAALAFIYEEKNEFRQAAQYWRYAAAVNENSQTTPYFLMQAAKSLELAKDGEGALQIYKQIKERYPLSTEGQQVDKYIARYSPE
jgi:tetratricopeptide (TPR) repeat protein